MTDNAVTPEPLFYEQGASWLWALAGPVGALLMVGIQYSAGYGLQLLVPAFFMVLVTGFLSIQIKAGRVHTSVELTASTLRQGTETIRIDEIERVYPEATRPEEHKWQAARALGELSGVPRGRKGIGLKLTNDRTAQAWAKRPQQLRQALTNLVEEQVP